jgi:hypothetical protein
VKVLVNDWLYSINADNYLLYGFNYYFWHAADSALGIAALEWSTPLIHYTCVFNSASSPNCTIGNVR